MKKSFIIFLILVILALAEGTPVKAQDKFGDERIPAFNTAARVVAVALAEVGYEEGENNYSIYGIWNGLNYTPWCGSFVSWSAHSAGVPTTSIKRYANYCIGEIKWFKSEKRWKNSDYKPQPGDIIFIDSSYIYEHTGIVVKCVKDIVYTVEGNAKDMVKEKQYAVNDNMIIGYGIPKYNTAKSYANDGLIAQQEVTLDSKSLTIKIESKDKLTANISPETTVMTRVWTSTNRKICSVNTKGEIIGISAGVAVISVEITNGKVAKCKVTVKK